MNAVDLAFVAGGSLVIAFLLMVRRHRRPSARLSRLSKHVVRSAPARGARLADRLVTVLLGRPVGATTACAALAAGAGLLLGGPVAGFVAGLYVAVAVHGLRSHLVRRRADRSISDLLDAVDAASGDLRAGLLPEPGNLLGRQIRRDDAAVRAAVARLDAAQRISEALGTPLADLLDRVDADVRAGQHVRANVTAQTAGAQTTTVLLVGLPVVGLWIGAGLGVDPIGQLLHTRLGGCCAVVAATLQCAGLWWTGRIVRGAVQEVC